MTKPVTAQFWFIHGVWRMMLCVCLDGAVAHVCGQVTQPTSRYYYAIENLDNGQTLRRGKTTVAGISQGDLILAPDTNYREWLYNADTKLIGFTDFRTPQSGQRFTIPPINLGLPSSPDFDNDGLSDDAEFIVGTNPTNPDTDGDGIKDGPAIALGLDPGAAARTGIVGSVDTPGSAVDVCAINDIVILANSDQGIAVFNVFNRMVPLVIAQVDTPGNAQRVACSGNLIAVADGAEGLAVIDITDPPAAKIVRQVPLGGSAQAVTAGGGIAYVGSSSGQIVAVDLASGVILNELTLSAAIQDLALDGDYLYALTPGSLSVITGLDGNMMLVVPVGAPSDSKRLFVGGGIAYATYSRGYYTYNVGNPSQPSLITPGAPSVLWQQLVANGSGIGLATTGQIGGSDDVSVYDISIPTQDGVFQTTFSTPGLAQAISIYNGLAYVADGDAGLQVINYLAFDIKGVPPTIALSASFTMSSPTNGVAEEGKILRVTAKVSDDVQVRNVEFYIDDIKVATDGSFPFEHRFVAPTITPQRASFRLRARASDTGGNFTFTDEMVVVLSPDATPPKLRKTNPPDGSVTNGIDTIFVYFNEPIDLTSINGTNLFLTSAGADNRLGTPDDLVLTNASLSYLDAVNAGVISFATPLPFGFYRVVASSFIRDAAGNALGTNVFSTFALLAGGPDGDDDGDGLTNAQELQLGTNPLLADSDGDGWSDGDEVQNKDVGGDPVDPNKRPNVTFVAMPPVQVDLPSPETFGTSSNPVVIATPPLEIDLPSPETFGASGNSIVIAHPLLVIDLLSPETFGTSGNPVVIATPPLEIDLPSPETFGTGGNSIVIARPPVVIDLLSAETAGTSGLPLILAKPPVSLKIPKP